MDLDSLNKEENLFHIIRYKFFPYWPVFVILLSLSLAAGWAYLKYTEPLYEATASLIINDENKGVDDPRMTESINMFASKKIVENEIEVIHSRALMSKVVTELNLYAPVMEQKKFKSVSAYISSPIEVKLKYPDKLTQDLDNIPAYFFTYDSLRKEVTVNQKKYPLNEWVRAPFGEVMFLPNSNYLKSSRGPLYFYFIHPQIITDVLLKELYVTPVSKVSTVINLHIKDHVRERGEDILNQLIHSYHQIAITDRNLLAANTLTFIEDRIKFVEKELGALENQVQKYKSAEGIVDLSEQGKVFLQSVSDNDQKIADINVQLAVLDKVERYILNKESNTGIVPATLGVEDPVLTQLLKKLYDTEIEYQRLSKTTAENNPLLTSVSGEIEKIRPSILENIRSQRENLKAMNLRLSSAKGKYSSALQTIPKQEQELLEISRQQAIKNSVYSFLLQKREEAALSYAPTEADSKVVDMAESSIWPVSPSPLKVYVVALALAVALGFAFVTGKELFNNKIMFRSEIEAYSKAPIVGELSKVKLRKDKIFVAPSDVIVIEQFRQLRTTMGLYGRKFSKKKILITSSIPGEGKSFVSTNLAYSLASSGKKVALIDLDLRNPNTSVQFNYYRLPGVIEYLKDEIGLDELIHPTSFRNLYVLPAGRSLGDNTELLLNGRIEKLFSSLENTFDYILMDSSPADLVSDAFLLSEFSDITLLVLRHAHTPKNVLQSFNQSNKKILKNMAIVFNGVGVRGFVKGYGFGYGYGNIDIYKDKYFKANAT
ncbi:GumC family protein [Pontibacter burrus]|uniref:non-specific protein-tyrosine kinase n=1 Tax=Pontibacter burrus TaxID=2704466 RepID=A0A6B3LW84_9BACT|nr:polysaccharide biosynthesis tyrosine autokinase [Pontibacter burrus]NEM97747.1 polysaccharide biosynthesis tyrosine autokinase [Pontibacter burrus]